MLWSPRIDESPKGVATEAEAGAEARVEKDLKIGARDNRNP